ncbi:MAG: hypothetical protein KAR20_09810, partial [Candidatus Heimdallarchaeota archaeon]|nr:hypothetical protein [Candidatus Heimdallarchaeota archaeon]
VKTEKMSYISLQLHNFNSPIHQAKAGNLTVAEDLPVISGLIIQVLPIAYRHLALYQHFNPDFEKHVQLKPALLV